MLAALRHPAIPVALLALLVADLLLLPGGYGSWDGPKSHAAHARDWTLAKARNGPNICAHPPNPTRVLRLPDASLALAPWEDRDPATPTIATLRFNATQRPVGVWALSAMETSTDLQVIAVEDIPDVAPASNDELAAAREMFQDTLAPTHAAAFGHAPEGRATSLTPIWPGIAHDALAFTVFVLLAASIAARFEPRRSLATQPAKGVSSPAP